MGGALRPQHLVYVWWLFAFQLTCPIGYLFSVSFWRIKTSEKNPLVKECKINDRRALFWGPAHRTGASGMTSKTPCRHASSTHRSPGPSQFLGSWSNQHIKRLPEDHYKILAWPAIDQVFLDIFSEHVIQKICECVSHVVFCVVDHALFDIWFLRTVL